MSIDRDLDDIEALDELSALYREARAVEPPAQLDERVLAAARRELETGRFQRRLRPRWIAPLALAATLALAVGLVAVLQRTQAPLDAIRPLEPTQRTAPAAAGSVAEPGAEAPAQQPQRRLRTDQQPAPAPEPLRVQPQFAPAPSEQRLRQTEERIAPGAVELSSDAASELKTAAPPLSPEAWLAAIVELRRQGRTAEAETALREFRLRYPDYPLDALPDAAAP